MLTANKYIVDFVSTLLTNKRIRFLVMFFFELCIRQLRISKMIENDFACHNLAAVQIDASIAYLFAFLVFIFAISLRFVCRLRWIFFCYAENTFQRIICTPS